MEEVKLQKGKEADQDFRASKGHPFRSEQYEKLKGLKASLGEVERRNNFDIEPQVKELKCNLMKTVRSLSVKDVIATVGLENDELFQDFTWTV